MKDSVHICSSGLRIEYMNPRMISRVGRNATGDYSYNAIYGSDEKCSWCMLDNILLSEHIDYELVDPRDNLFYSITNSPIFHSSGRISKLTISRDITDNKSIETQLHQAMEETGGVLDILVERITLNESANNHYSDLTPGDWLKITVKDSDPGIRPDIIDRIFDPYFTTKKHSAVESAINGLENHGLDRCPDHGIIGFKRYVSLSVLARNLQIIGHHIQPKELKLMQRKFG